MNQSKYSKLFNVFVLVSTLVVKLLILLRIVNALREVARLLSFGKFTGSITIIHGGLELYEMTRCRYTAEFQNLPPQRIGNTVEWVEVSRSDMD